MRAGIVVMIMTTALVSAPLEAGAITRSQVMKRAKSWVAKRVPYSQSSYHAGYRQDCSGFVSMSWKLGKSYTSRTISSRAKRIKMSSLKPGDAVLIPGHVSIFGGWKNKKKRQYYAYEETTWGSHAKKRVRTIASNATFLRRKGIKSSAPKKATAASAVTTPTLTPPTLAVAASIFR